MSSEWKEAKAKRAPGNVWNYQRGYRVSETGRHENEREYQAFMIYLNMKGNRSLQAVADECELSMVTISKYYSQFCWDKRVIAFDTAQTAMIWREANKLDRNQHREQILQFRDSQEKQARMMARVSEDLLRVLGKRIEQADLNDEEIPMNVVSGLLKAASSVSDQSRQAWATSLGVNEMLDMVETEIQKVDVMELEEEDPYDIPIEE